MYIRKRHKKNIANIMLSIWSLFFLWYFVIFAESYQAEERIHWVSASANFLSIKSNWDDDWQIQFSNIIIWDFSDRFTYIVQSWDSLSSIASRFWTTVDNIKKVNDLSSDNIRTWQKLTIAQEEWIIYEIDEEIKLDDFANKYWLELSALQSINYISDESFYLESWTEIFIPISKDEAVNVWLVEEEEEVIAQQPAWWTQERPQGHVWWAWTAWSGETISSYYYNPQINNWFFAWHCTWYVAYKLFREHRPWWGNARDWYHNAQSAWYDVWSTAREWSIVVIRYWAWYWRSYWHVAIVNEVDWENNMILIEEMNYSGRFIVTKRRIDMYENIVWYIYY